MTSSLAETKRCGGCDLDVPCAEFWKSRSNPDGLQNYCRHCSNEARRARKSLDPDYFRSQKKAWDKKNADRLKEYRRQRWAEHGARLSAEQKVARTANVERTRQKTRRGHLRKHYGLTVEEYAEMLAAQGGVCAICRRECPTGRQLSVDHDHRTGAVRSLLCATCNGALGMVRDNPEILRQLIAYIKVHTKGVPL